MSCAPYGDEDYGPSAAYAEANRTAEEWEAIYVKATAEAEVARARRNLAASSAARRRAEHAAEMFEAAMAREAALAPAAPASHGWGEDYSNEEVQPLSAEDEERAKRMDEMDREERKRRAEQVAREEERLALEAAIAASAEEERLRREAEEEEIAEQLRQIEEMEAREAEQLGQFEEMEAEVCEVEEVPEAIAVAASMWSACAMLADKLAAKAETPAMRRHVAVVCAYFNDHFVHADNDNREACNTIMKAYYYPALRIAMHDVMRARSDAQAVEAAYAFIEGSADCWEFITGPIEYFMTIFGAGGSLDYATYA